MIQQFIALYEVLFTYEQYIYNSSIMIRKKVFSFGLNLIKLLNI